MKSFSDLVFRPHPSGSPGHLLAQMNFVNGHNISVTNGGPYTDADAEHPFEALSSVSGDTHGYQTISDINSLMEACQKAPFRAMPIFDRLPSLEELRAERTR